SHYLGFGFSHAIVSNPGANHSSQSQWWLVVPYWFLILVTSIAPAQWCFSRRRHRRRLHKGLCPICGYDLRASKEKCPECGTPIQPKPAASAVGSETIL